MIKNFIKRRLFDWFGLYDGDVIVNLSHRLLALEKNLLEHQKETLSAHSIENVKKEIDNLKEELSNSYCNKNKKVAIITDTTLLVNIDGIPKNITKILCNESITTVKDLKLYLIMHKDKLLNCKGIGIKTIELLKEKIDMAF